MLLGAYGGQIAVRTVRGHMASEKGEQPSSIIRVAGVWRTIGDRHGKVVGLQRHWRGALRAFSRGGGHHRKTIAMIYTPHLPLINGFAKSIPFADIRSKGAKFLGCAYSLGFVEPNTRADTYCRRTSMVSCGYIYLKHVRSFAFTGSEMDYVRHVKLKPWPLPSFGNLVLPLHCQGRLTCILDRLTGKDDLLVKEDGAERRYKDGQERRDNHPERPQRRGLLGGEIALFMVLAAGGA